MGRLPGRQNASLFSDSIRGAIAVLESLDGIYEHTLLVHRLFKCLSVSVHPLCVQELAGILQSDLMRHHPFI